MALSTQTQQALTEALTAVEAWGEARLDEIDRTRDFLESALTVPLVALSDSAQEEATTSAETLINSILSS